MICALHLPPPTLRRIVIGGGRGLAECLGAPGIARLPRAMLPAPPPGSVWGLPRTCCAVEGASACV